MEPKYTCIIVDDEPLARKLLMNYVARTPLLQLEGAFKSAAEVVAFLKKNETDLLFSDIRMPGLSGIGLLENNDNLPAVIFTTAYEEYAVKAFELEVIDYLVKPFPIERFQKAVLRFEASVKMKQQGNATRKFLEVKVNHGFIRIPHDQILYVETMGEYMKLVLEEQQSELIYIRMKELEARLGDGFVRIHKSYLVNQEKVNKLSGNYVMIGDEQLKVSRLYKPDVLKMFK